MFNIDFLSFQLSNNAIQAMLHSIRQVIRGLSNNINTISKNLAHILQRRLVALAGLISLGSSHKSLDIVWLVLQNGSGVTNDAIEVGELLVAGGSVVIALQSEVSRLKKNI